MSKHGRKYQEALALVEKGKLYSLSEAIPLLRKTSPVKFDASCEVHMNLGVNPKHADQMVRATVALPHGTGKEVKVIAFVPDDLVKEAKSAGAVEAGNTELIEKIEKGWLDFDVAVATPDMMKSLGKIAKTLGQKGLMPNPKAGTVTPNIGTTIAEIKKGKVEFRIDKLANIHNVFGKVSFDEARLMDNIKTFVKAVSDVKPAGIKGTYIKTIILTTTMGPGIPLNVSAALSEAA